MRTQGLRPTSSRVAIFCAVAETADHADVQSVVQRVAADLGSVSVQAVYDGLQALTAAGMLRRIQPAGSPARFEARVGDNHHHIICRSCGVTRDVDCTIGVAPCLEPEDAQGFVVDEAEIVFWGLCPDCSKPTTERSP